MLHDLVESHAQVSRDLTGSMVSLDFWCCVVVSRDSVSRDLADGDVSRDLAVDVLSRDLADGAVSRDRLYRRRGRGRRRLDAEMLVVVVYPRVPVRRRMNRVVRHGNRVYLIHTHLRCRHTMLAVSVATGAGDERRDMLSVA